MPQLVVKKQNVDYLVNEYSSMSSIVDDIQTAMKVNTTDEISAELWKNENGDGSVYWIMKVLVPLSPGEQNKRTIVKVLPEQTNVGKSIVYINGIQQPIPTTPTGNILTQYNQYEEELIDI